MELKANHTQLCHVLTVALALLVGAVAADQPPSSTPPPPNQTLPGCNYKCGNVEVPYPFGIGNSTINNQQPCFLSDKFSLSCEASNLTLYGGTGNIQDINLEGQMQMLFFVSRLCNYNKSNRPSFQVPSFAISSRENKFITVGCDSYGYLNSNYEGATYTIGCVTRCYNSDPDMIIGNSDGKCTGLGCCQVDIPPRMTNFTIKVYEFPNSSLSENKNCSYSFIAKQGSYNFSVDHLGRLPYETFPLFVNWAVSNESCEIAKTKPDYACKGNSECVDNDTDYDGYRCKCKDGFEGNPYLPEGCRGSVAADQPPSTPPPPNQTLALPGCKYTCGDVKIPYPFGIGYSTIDNHRPCFLNRKFSLSCNNSNILNYEETLVIQDINLEGQMQMSFWVSSLCYNRVEANRPFMVVSFTISSRENKFITVGCDSYGYLNSNYDGATYSTGCLTSCYNSDPDMIIGNSDGKCTGLGCCQVDIPPRMKNITIKVHEFPNSTLSKNKKNCSYSFIAKQDSYKFSVDHLGHLPNGTFPLIVNWAVADEKCEIAKNKSYYACKANSECVDKDTDYDGYRCKWKDGFEGNPYLPEGCRDINECVTSNHTCVSSDNCQNTFGSYKCFCPKGQSGNGTKEGSCHRRDVTTRVVIGAGTGVIVILVGISLLYLMYQKRKFIKLKEKFFRQNGGLILLQQLSTREDSSQTARIFTEDQLKKATNNYDENNIIGRGGFGTVFKGILIDKRIVAIKKSKIIDASQIEQFINEVVVLSQINHRNVVKLLGCCLETEVPLLVYEFVSNGTLSDFIHTKCNENNVPWKTRLKVATEVAEALSYLHSAASMPIIHRDVKSANILLDNNHTAKVSDFGASKLIPLDQNEVATMVQGTIGYLDPEYMQTSQLTEKSDVYSFGVVLVELLTGEKPFSFCRPEEKRSLSMHFLSCLKKDCLFEVLQDGVLNEENKQEIKEVAILAAKCLRLKGEERPSMKEVAMELEGFRLMEKHSWINSDPNLEETRYLLHEASFSSYEFGGSSKHGDTGYDNLKDHALIVLDDGR